jgi:hypothetical protein
MRHFLGADRRLVACITSNLSRIGQTRISIEKNSAAGKHMGLLMDSVIVVDDLATVFDDEVDKVMGRCPAMDKVDDAIKVLFGLH